MKPKKDKTVCRRVGLLEIYPNMSTDTFNGKKMTSGVMFMSMHCGEGSLEHKGKTHKFGLACVLSGETIVSFDGGRQVKINLRKFIDAAIEAGALEKKINFTDKDAE